MSSRSNSSIEYEKELKHWVRAGQHIYEVIKKQFILKDLDKSEDPSSYKSLEDLEAIEQIAT